MYQALSNPQRSYTQAEYVCIAAYVMQNGQRPKAKGKVTYLIIGGI